MGLLDACQLVKIHGLRLGHAFAAILHLVRVKLVASIPLVILLLSRDCRHGHHWRQTLLLSLGDRHG